MTDRTIRGLRFVEQIAHTLSVLTNSEYCRGNSLTRGARK